jgi:hypothetical protein
VRIHCNEESACAEKFTTVIAVSYLPEVLDDGILFVVAAVVGVLGPVIDINLRNTTNEQLKLTLIEDVDKV